MKRKFFAVFSVLVLLVAALPAFAGAAPTNPDEIINLGANTDNPSHPLGDKQAELRGTGQLWNVRCAMSVARLVRATNARRWYAKSAGCSASIAENGHALSTCT